VLEGYKVADEIAKHGAARRLLGLVGLQVEVWDAIPYAFPLMRERGVVVSFNSDSDELARRLEPRGAQGGQVRRRRAGGRARLRDVELRAQLGIDDRVGSLAPARTATSSSGAAIRSSTTVALQTWIEGRKYFDRDAERASRPEREKERADLVAKAKAWLDRDSGGDEGQGRRRQGRGAGRLRAAGARR
jgi:hypothetical protein